MLCKPFDEYIADCVKQIKERRTDLDSTTDPEIIITANSPFEMRPDTSKPFRQGALLIHGLFDCPFSLYEIGLQLKNAGVLCRAILLPGHGTQPTDLLKVSHQDWIETVRYGIESLSQEVENVYLVGYSTGGTLSIYHALNNANINGIVLLAPALKILPPVSTILKWPVLANFFSREDKWLCQEEETDYTKYTSVPFHPVFELGKLIQVIRQNKQAIHCPILTFMSHDDETVSTHAALRFFANQPNEANRFVLYSARNHAHATKNIEVRSSVYPQLNIRRISHIAIPFSATNSHYGQNGDYFERSHLDHLEKIYGAYNRVEIKLYEKLHRLRLLKSQRHTLTYNPDFDYMAESIVRFIATPPTN